MRVQVVEAKAGAGSATLSMARPLRSPGEPPLSALPVARPVVRPPAPLQAAAAVEFAEACARAKLGEPGVEACAYVASALTEHPFFASRVRLGRFGLEEILPLGPLNALERAGLAKMGPELKASIDKGVAFANK